MDRRKARALTGGLRAGLLLALTVAAPPLLAQVHTSLEGKNCSFPHAVAEVRPNAGGPPVDVAVEVVLVDLFEINDAAQSFLADVVITLRWNDPRLATALRSQSWSRCKVAVDSIWHPDVRPLNQRARLRQFGPTLDVSSHGAVTYSVQTLSQFSSRLDLRRFPFDGQELRTKAAAFANGPGEVAFQARQARIDRKPEWSVSGWSLKGNFTVVEAPMVVAGEEFVRFDHVIVVERQAGYYLWNFGLPLCLIVLMAWTVFWLDPKTASGAQIGIATASTFTLIAFLISLRARLPPVGYLTDLDKLSVYSTTLVFIALGQVVLTAWLVQRERVEVARRLDFHGRWLYLLAFVLGLGFVWTD